MATRRERRHDREGHGGLDHRRHGHLTPVEHLAVEGGGAGVAEEAVRHGSQRVVEELDVAAVEQGHRRGLSFRRKPQERIQVQRRSPRVSRRAQNGSTARATMSRARMVATGPMAASCRAMVSATTGAAR